MSRIENIMSAVSYFTAKIADLDLASETYHGAIAELRALGVTDEEIKAEQ